MRLIVNGDDFGASKEVNEAIIRAFHNGILTSCSLMATGMAFDHAVLLAGENPGLAVGIHLVTVMGRAVLPPCEIPHLVDAEGNFLSDPTAAGLKYHFSPSARGELARELAAQFEKLHATGIHISHIDSHLHMHVHPAIFKIAMELGESYRVKRMRIPADDLPHAIRFNKKKPFNMALHALIFRMLTGRMRKKLRKRGFTFTDRVYGHFMSGRMNEDYVLFVLDHLRAGASELYLHPAINDEETALSRVEWQGRREFDILMSAEVIECIRDRGIELTNYQGLEENE